VIRVQVREEHAAHVLPPHLQLVEALQGAAPRIEEKFLASGFDQDTRPESVHDGRGTSVVLSVVNCVFLFAISFLLAVFRLGKPIAVSPRCPDPRSKSRGER